jgi:D-alanyl-D-alanine carboxypeptidase
MNKTLPRILEETQLVEFSENGRSFQLHPEALKAWEEMKTKAITDGVKLRIVSAFRSVHRQAEIIGEKKKKGLSEKVIFKVSAPPGFSEHHSGRAIDISTPGYPSLEEVFEDSEAFDWLLDNAGDYGFRLSYPRDNAYRIAYEPWHWFYEKITQPSASVNVDESLG